MKFKIGMFGLAFSMLVATQGAWAAIDDSALINQGNAQWGAGRLDDARKSFEQALVANPASIAGNMRLAGLLLASGKYELAIKTYQKTLSLDAKNVRAWMGLGIAYRHAGDKELSRSAFEEAIRIEPARREQLAKLTEK